MEFMNTITRKCSSILKITLFVFLFLQNISPVLAGDATLTWNAPITNVDGTPLTDLSGYKVYYGTSPGNYSTSINVGNQTTYTITGLGYATYYSAVTAYDTSGNESGFSNEVSKTFSAPDTTPPQISGISTSGITTTSAVVIWATNEAATTQVEYGTTTAYGSATTLDSTLVTSHTQSLTGLQSNLVYYYRVKSSDGAGNPSVSGDQVFTTDSAPDTTPPGNVQSFKADATDQQITLSWVNPPDLDFIGVRIRYRTDHYPSGINDGVLLGDFTSQPNEAMSTTQISLQNGVTYYYSASSYDHSGNYQETAYTSVTLPSSSSGLDSSNNVTMSGGCGMVFPSNGKPPGPAQAADMVGLLAVILIAILKKELQKKKSFDRLLRVSDIIRLTRFPFRQRLKRGDLQKLYLATACHTIFYAKTWFLQDREYRYGDLNMLRQ